MYDRCSVDLLTAQMRMIDETTRPTELKLQHLNSAAMYSTKRMTQAVKTHAVTSTALVLQSGGTSNTKLLEAFIHGRFF